MHVGYNPAVSGLNLNYNRVRLDWTPGKAGPDYGFLAPGADFAVDIAGIGGVAGEAPPPRHRMDGTREVWDLPVSRMTKAGKLWLPVRRPSSYAGEVFQSLAGERGVILPEPEPAALVPAGTELAGHDSQALEPMLRDMLLYSTNLTAEVVGLRASQARGAAPAGLAESAAAMTEWARARYGIETAAFVNHSGLSDLSLWPASETVRVLAAEADILPALMKPRPIVDAERREMRLQGVHAVAKTGTLYFASGLGGYVEGRGRRFAFAIYSADPARRAQIVADAADPPPGARGWAGRARLMQEALLRHWVDTYMPVPPLRPMPRRG
jgi:serine-type D-Ala-D-Ala carboxypeptidase/endopeptidase (penicillin-binding protein 4)